MEHQALIHLDHRLVQDLWHSDFLGGRGQEARGERGLQGSTDRKSKTDPVPGEGPGWVSSFNGSSCECLTGVAYRPHPLGHRWGRPKGGPSTSGVDLVPAAVQPQPLSEPRKRSSLWRTQLLASGWRRETGQPRNEGARGLQTERGPEAVRPGRPGMRGQEGGLGQQRMPLSGSVSPPPTPPPPHWPKRPQERAEVLVGSRAAHGPPPTSLAHWGGGLPANQFSPLTWLPLPIPGVAQHPPSLLLGEGGTSWHGDQPSQVRHSRAGKGGLGRVCACVCMNPL